MKRNILIEGLVNFLIPVIILYATFLLVKNIQEGFFTVIYSLLLFLIAALMHFATKKQVKKVTIAFALEITIWLFFFASFFYLISVFLLLIS